MLQDNEIKPQQVQNENDDEISLIDLFAVLLRRKWMIIIITALAMVGVVIYSVISLKLPPEKSYMPNTYKVEANMLIKDSSGSGKGGASSTAGAAAALLGINLGGGGGSSNSALILYLTSSNPFYDAVAEHFDLYTKFDFEKSPIANTREVLKKAIKTEFDSGTGVLTISSEDIDPEFSVKLIDFTVDWISNKLDELGIDENKISKANLEKNIDISWKEVLRLTKEMAALQDKVAQGRAMWTKEYSIEQKRLELELNAQQEVYTQLRTQLELLKVDMQTETPVFQVLERPSIPDIKSGPSRGKLCIIVTFAAFFVSIFLAFLLNAIENIKKDPEAMAKLKSTK